LPRSACLIAAAARGFAGITSRLITPLIELPIFQRPRRPRSGRLVVARAGAPGPSAQGRLRHLCTCPAVTCGKFKCQWSPRLGASVESSPGVTRGSGNSLPKTGMRRPSDRASATAVAGSAATASDMLSAEAYTRRALSELPVEGIAWKFRPGSPIRCSW
jgi:hypothetical protein